MTWTWDRAREGIGWPIALILSILIVILWVQGSLSQEAAIVGLAICANRL
jgi:hypothetical protein